MTRTAAVLLSITLTLLACSREASHSTAATDRPAAAAVATAPSRPEARTLAGEFRSPGVHLLLDADGSYRLTVHAQSADLQSAGTWQREADGRHLVLEPDAAGEPDRRFELVRGALRPINGGADLRRVPTPRQAP